MPDPHPASRRIKAAMALAGLDSANQLAERIDKHGYRASTLRKFMSGEREPRRPDLQLIAEAVELPYEWFTADIAAALGSSPATDGDDGRLAQLEATVEQILETLADLAPPTSPAKPKVPRAARPPAPGRSTPPTGTPARTGTGAPRRRATD